MRKTGRLYIKAPLSIICKLDGDAQEFTSSGYLLMAELLNECIVSFIVI